MQGVVSIHRLPLKRMLFLNKKAMNNLKKFANIDIFAAASPKQFAEMVAREDEMKRSSNAQQEKAKGTRRSASVAVAGDGAGAAGGPSTALASRAGTPATGSTLHKCSTFDGEKDLYVGGSLGDDIVLVLNNMFDLKNNGLAYMFGLDSLSTPNPLRFDNMLEFKDAEHTWPTSLVRPGSGNVYFARLLTPPPTKKATAIQDQGVVLDKASLSGLSEVDADDLLKWAPNNVLRLCLYQALLDSGGARGYMAVPELRTGAWVQIKHAQKRARHKFAVVVAVAKAS